MTEAERTAFRMLVNAAKGARDTLDRLPPGTPPGNCRVARDLRRLDEAIGAGEAMLSGAGSVGA